MRYGKGEHNRIWRERFNLHRLALHCTSLRVLDLSIDCPLADDMARAIESAREAYRVVTS